MKNRLTALILTLTLAAAILIGCTAAATERNETEIQVTENMTAAPENVANTDAILTSEAAEAIAFSNEGLTAGQVTYLVSKYEIDDGEKEYEIDFRSGDYEYEITVNAETGKITSRDKEYDPVVSAPAATEAPTEAAPAATEPPATEAPKATEPAPEKITADEAKAIALKDAGLKESEVTGLKAEFDADDNEYDVDFYSGDYDYDYTVNAKTGAIKEKDKEKEPVKQTSSTSTTKTESASTTKSTSSNKSTSSTKTGSSDKITADKAKSIALKDAGLKESKVTGLRAEYDKDDNEYDVDFRSGDYEYDYTINAKTGKIKEKDKEYDPEKKSSTKATEPKATEPKATEPKATEPKATEPKATEPAEEKISASKAKSIALKHAGVSSGDAKGMECEYDVDDGKKVYEVSFRSGKYEYDYEINAITGKIISWNKEIDD